MSLTWAAGSVVAMVFIWHQLVRGLQATARGIFSFNFLILVAGVVGMLLAAFAAGMVMNFLVCRISRRWGRTPTPGDRVINLSRKHRARASSVYDVWYGRRQLRVNPGEKEKRQVTDVRSCLTV